jgi:hypothetical protein
MRCNVIEPACLWESNLPNEGRHLVVRHVLRGVRFIRSMQEMTLLLAAPPVV